MIEQIRGERREALEKVEQLEQSLEERNREISALSRQLDKADSMWSTDLGEYERQLRAKDKYIYLLKRDLREATNVVRSAHERSATQNGGRGNKRLRRWPN